MAWRRVLSQVAWNQSAYAIYNELVIPNPSRILGGDINAGGALRNLHWRYKSSYVGSFAHRMRHLDSPSEASMQKDFYRFDPEHVIQTFESQPSLHSNPKLLYEYVKALVKVDRLEESTLLKTLQRGRFQFLRSCCFSKGGGKPFVSISALKSAGQVTKDGIIGTANAPIHMVTAETGQFKEQLWRTFRSIALAFLLISGIGALIEDRGTSKGLGLNE
ncbi:hypothetical protein GUJ93_ZPchr0008g12889 [Zizania palustris]|uniref:Uncharacterized protein n=1 Tax=Zizania palustris TaxID=103762 RepID=A0A8J5RE53_ZIZPA|nr:hypothetical protein GUJ93_ZPchr0008g12889 [Zizania palustris]